MVYSNVLQAIGNTPLVEITKFKSPNSARIFAKLENLNVGGSIKTRTAYNMIKQAKEKGLLKEGEIIVEASSGNQGVGLALVGAVLGHKVVIVMPSSVSEERQKLIKQYGAKTVVVKDDGDIGKCIEKCVQIAKKIQKDRGGYMPNQFENQTNAYTHEKFTAQEIISALGDKIHGFCAGVGSGGSLTGIGKALKEVNEQVQIWAVEPTNSAILSGKKVGTHLQMGIGDGIIPPILNREIINEVFTVDDKTAIYYAKELALREGILCGISSGSNLACAIKLAKTLGEDKNVVTLFPDTGERYFSTPLFD